MHQVNVLLSSGCVADSPAERHVIKYECCIEDYIDLTFSVTLRRRPKYYVINLVIPVALLSALALLTFLLPSDAGEKIGLSASLPAF
jgi:nicotinic acetylcholine receptor